MLKSDASVMKKHKDIMTVKVRFCIWFLNYLGEVQEDNENESDDEYIDHNNYKGK